MQETIAASRAADRSQNAVKFLFVDLPRLMKTASATLVASLVVCLALPLLFSV